MNPEKFRKQTMKQTLNAQINSHPYEQLDVTLKSKLRWVEVKYRVDLIDLLTTPPPLSSCKVLDLKNQSVRDYHSDPSKLNKLFANGNYMYKRWDKWVGKRYSALNLSFVERCWVEYADRLLPTMRQTQTMSVLQHRLTIFASIIDYLKHVDHLTGKSLRIWEHLNIKAICKLVGLETNLIDETFIVFQAEKTIPDLLKTTGIPTRKTILRKMWRDQYKDFCSHEIFSRIVMPKLEDVNACCGINKVVLWEWYHQTDRFVYKSTFRHEGVDYPVIVHAHECVLDERKLTSIYQTPKDVYWRSIQSRIISKQYSFLRNHGTYITFKTTNDEARVKRLVNYQDLYHEGYLMHHCIGGNGYPDKGLNRQALFFRYIPIGVSPNDHRNHYTVTLYNTADIWSSLEMSGYRNINPDPKIRLEFKRFVNDNLNTFLEAILQLDDTTSSENYDVYG